MKKMMVWFMVLAMALAGTACGGSDSAAPTSAAAENSAIKDEVPATEAPAETEPEASAVPFEEVTLIDDDNCRFVVSAIEKEGFWGYTLKAELENKTDKTLVFSWNDVSVDGWMIDPFWASEVAPGMKSKENITFMSGLEEAGISDPTQINFSLSIYDSDNWETKYADEKMSIYPQGAEAATSVIRADQASDIILMENDSCRVIATSFGKDDIWGYVMSVYLENKTDKQLIFSAEDVAVNGYMCDPFWASTVNPGCRSNASMTWMDTTLAESGIEDDFHEISMSMHVSDTSTFDEVCNETIKIDVP